MASILNKISSMFFGKTPDTSIYSFTKMPEKIGIVIDNDQNYIPFQIAKLNKYENIYFHQDSDINVKYSRKLDIKIVNSINEADIIVYSSDQEVEDSNISRIDILSIKETKALQDDRLYFVIDINEDNLHDALELIKNHNIIGLSYSKSIFGCINSKKFKGILHHKKNGKNINKYKDLGNIQTKIQSGDLNFNDIRQIFKQANNLAGLGNSIMGITIPPHMIETAKVMCKMIDSMTTKERIRACKLTDSRIERICKGSGVQLNQGMQTLKSIDTHFVQISQQVSQIGKYANDPKKLVEMIKQMYKK